MGCFKSKPTEDFSAQEVVIDDTTVFRSLLEAFRVCDPQFSSKIYNIEDLKKVAKKLSLSLTANAGDRFISELKGMNFVDFVKRCKKGGVELDVGLDLTKGLRCPNVFKNRTFPVPHDWQEPKRGTDSFHLREVTDKVHLEELQEALIVSYQKIQTRFRKGTGDIRVPTGYKLRKASRNENYRLWANYYMKVYHMEEKHKNKEPLQMEMSASSPLRLRHNLESRFNEWMLFRPSQDIEAEAVCKEGFRGKPTDKDTNVYLREFAESITKADERVREDHVDNDGLCCVLLCRVAGGLVLRNDEAMDINNKWSNLGPSAHMFTVNDSRGKKIYENLQELLKPLKKRDFDSVLCESECESDIGKIKVRDVLIYDTDQFYPEYILWYERIYDDAF